MDEAGLSAKSKNDNGNGAGSAKKKRLFQEDDSDDDERPDDLEMWTLKATLTQTPAEQALIPCVADAEGRTEITRPQ